MSDANDYEKLGAFYLGRTVSEEGQEGRQGAEPFLYDAKDLTTHAVCVGMTGSGKTGLCVTLLEEAAIDGIPSIAIDPKGDLCNLLLTFPGLSPAEFRPWIDEGEAAREGRSPDEHARHVAASWRKGLADWGEDGERIRRFRDSVEACIYTPGSQAGRPLRVLRSFEAPSAAVAADADAMRERIQAAVSGLLGLLGVDADPIRSREHILVSNVIGRAWSAGRDLDLPTLIREIQSPPFEKVGVFDLETFFPADDRLELAMTLNNLLASPGFSSWMEGEPLDVGRLLYTAEGKPRLSVLSIAHLSESERMFFVTLLLNQVVSWMRGQPGTQSLRAILYMDEVFGYFPPTANPPSKRPMLTLLKQARAYGLGVVLATQNPVDLDYKGLSNTGTWLLGRLQTERDKARVIEGLEGVSATSGAAFDRSRMERLLAGLGKRVFLMNNVHEDEPQLFHTRWALSYLRGPLTRQQIRRLNQETGGAMPDAEAPGQPAAPAEPARTRPGKKAAPSPPPTAAERGLLPTAAERGVLPTAADPGGLRTAAEQHGLASAAERVVLPAGIVERFAVPTEFPPPDVALVYRPTLYAVAHLHYANARAGVEEWISAGFQASLEEKRRGSPWTGAVEIDPARLDLREAPEAAAGFAEIGATVTAKGFARFEKMLKSHVYRARPLRLLRCKDPKAISQASESEGEFRVRLRQLLRERRDLTLAKLRKRWAPKLAKLQDRVRRAEGKVDEEREQYQSQKSQAAISMGATILGAIFGRKLGSSRNVGRATTAVRGAQRAARERGDIARAEENAKALQGELVAMEKDFQQELEAVRVQVDDSEIPCEELLVRPRKTDVGVEGLALVWMPWWQDAHGAQAPAVRFD